MPLLVVVAAIIRGLLADIAPNGRARRRIEIKAYKEKFGKEASSVCVRRGEVGNPWAGLYTCQGGDSPRLGKALNGGAVATRVETIATRVEAIAIRLRGWR